MLDDLRVEPCSHDAAVYAVTRWHYSATMPAGKLVKVGAWESDAFVGVVLFGRGAIPEIGDFAGLDQTEVVELVRVALREHRAPTSAIVTRAVALLRAQSPGLRLLVSYADTKRGHRGGIYQAMNWLYLGARPGLGWYRINGQAIHGRTVNSKWGTKRLDWLREHVDPNAAPIELPPKHKYVLPLDRAMRRQLAPLVQPYP